MKLQQFALILRARYKVALSVLLVTLSAAAVVTMMLPKKYTATSFVFIDIKPDPIAGMAPQPVAIPGYLATQMDIIKSDRVAAGVVKLLKLDENPAVQEAWMEATEGRGGDISSWLGKALRANLTVKPSRDSTVIELEYRAADPVLAADVVNGFTQTYIKTIVDLRVEPAQQYTMWFAEQSKMLRDNLEKAQRNLHAYQQKHGFVTGDERLDSETTKLNALMTQLTLVQVQAAEAMSKHRSGGSSDTLPEVTQSLLLTNLKSDAAKLEAKLQDLSVVYGRNHPQYQRVESELSALKQRVDTETRHITSGFATSERVGKDREGMLKAAVEAQKRKVLELRGQHDEGGLLVRDVDAAQKAYDAVTQRYSQVQLESRTTQANAAVLSSASVPLVPSSPKLLLNALLATMVGLILAVGSAVLLELGDRRVRSPLDLIETHRLPVLGVIGKANVHDAISHRLHAAPALPTRT